MISHDNIAININFTMDERGATKWLQKLRN